MTEIWPVVHKDCCPGQSCLHIFIPKSFKQSAWAGSRVCIPTDGLTCNARDIQKHTGYTSLLKNRLPPEDRKIGTRQMVPILTEQRGREKYIYLTSIRDVLWNCSNRFLAHNSDPTEWVGGAEALKEWFLEHKNYLANNPIDLGRLSRQMSYLSLQSNVGKRSRQDGFDPKYNYSQDVKVDVSSIPNAGRGVYTLKAHKKDEIVGQYVGRLITRDELNQMSREQVSKIISFVDGTNREQLIDGQGTNHWSSLINHKWRQRGNPRGAANLVTDSAGHFRCLRDIEAGEELLIDYGVHYWCWQLLHQDLDEINDTAEQIAIMKRVNELLPN